MKQIVNPECLSQSLKLASGQATNNYLSYNFQSLLCAWSNIQTLQRCVPQTQVWLAMLEHRSHFKLFHYTTLHYINYLLCCQIEIWMYWVWNIIHDCPNNRIQRILYSRLEHLSEHAWSSSEVTISCRIIRTALFLSGL